MTIGLYVIASAHKIAYSPSIHKAIHIFVWNVHCSLRTSEHCEIVQLLEKPDTPAQHVWFSGLLFKFVGRDTKFITILYIVCFRLEDHFGQRTKPHL